MENKIDVMRLMSDQMKAVIDKQNELAGDAFATDVPLEVMRDNYTTERKFWNEGGPEMAKTIEKVFDAGAGEYNTRFYYPVEAEKLPILVYIHGGGFVLGNLDTHDRICRLLAAETGAAVVAVDYHLSPESKFPTNIQECAHVAKFLHENGAEFGLDGNDISFAGDSGGAVLSMATNLWLRDEMGDNSYVKSLLLYYGFYGLQDSCSRRLFGNALDGLTKADLDYYNECLLTSPEEVNSPYIDMLSNDLETSMPACYVVAAGLDPLRDDSTALAAVLKERGVKVRYEVFDGVLHAFLHHSRMLDDTMVAIQHGAEFFKERNL